MYSYHTIIVLRPHLNLVDPADAALALRVSAVVALLRIRLLNGDAQLVQLPLTRVLDFQLRSLGHLFFFKRITIRPLCRGMLQIFRENDFTYDTVVNRKVPSAWAFFPAPYVHKQSFQYIRACQSELTEYYTRPRDKEEKEEGRVSY